VVVVVVSMTGLTNEEQVEQGKVNNDPLAL
jgi:hypothetical protein